MICAPPAAALFAACDAIVVAEATRPVAAPPDVPRVLDTLRRDRAVRSVDLDASGAPYVVLELPESLRPNRRTETVTAEVLLDDAGTLTLRSVRVGALSTDCDAFVELALETLADRVAARCPPTERRRP